MRLWAAADARTKPGDMGPPGFDPVTNSQDPMVRAFAVKVEKQNGASATVAAPHSALLHAGYPRLSRA